MAILTKIIITLYKNNYRAQTLLYHSLQHKN